MSKKLLSILISIITIVLFCILLLNWKIMYESFILSTQDFETSSLVFSEDKCEQKGLSCGHEYHYYISNDGVYIHYETSFFGEGWKYFSRNSSIGKDLISRLEGLNKDKQVENMKNFSYEPLGLELVH